MTDETANLGAPAKARTMMSAAIDRNRLRAPIDGGHLTVGSATADQDLPQARPHL